MAPIEPQRIVLTTFGSLGDLHPFIAIGLGLKHRGHDPVIATTEFYREVVQKEGLNFVPIRPRFGDRDEVKKLVREVLDMKTGPEAVIRRVVLPHLRDSHEDLLGACTGAKALITSTLAFAGPIVADQLRLPWISTTLQPLSFLSVYDNLELAGAPWLSSIRLSLPPLYRLLLRLAIKSTDSWGDPIRKLRTELGLPPPTGNPILAGGHSPDLVLAAFSKVLGTVQPDWPTNTVITGFPFYDSHGESSLPPQAEEFLKSGSPPVVFTLGSSAVMDAGDFYVESLKAAQQLGVRSLMLIGGEQHPNLPSTSSEFAVFDYLPYSLLFPRAAAIVHQGGVGTTGQALRAGRPMLIMPYGQDQPDNAARIVRIGSGRTIRRVDYRYETVVSELDALLNNPNYAYRAIEVGRHVQNEDGVSTACDAIEQYLQSKRYVSI